MVHYVNSQEIDGISVINFSGRIVLGDGTAELKEAVQSSLRKDRIAIILNLSEVSSIDSTGIGELVSALGAVESKKGHLVLAGLDYNSSIYEKLRLTRLDKLFNIYGDLGTALALFGPHRNKTIAATTFTDQTTEVHLG